MLVEVIYPEQLPQEQNIKPPTFLDFLISKSYLVHSENTLPDGWAQVIEPTHRQNSLPMGVHTSLPFTNEYTLNYLGILRPPYKNYYQWNDYKKNFSDEWNETKAEKLKEALEQICLQG